MLYEVITIAQAYSDQERFHAVQILEQEHLDQITVALQAIAEGSYGRCQHRITSYNVCYTKLLRSTISLPYSNS